MINKKNSLHILAIILLGSILPTINSCTSIINKFEGQDSDFIPKWQTGQTLCSKANPTHSLISRSKTTQDEFTSFIKELNDKKIKLSFIDKTILWSLIQMNARPSTNSPTSRFQALISINGDKKYWNFSAPTQQSQQENEPIPLPTFYGMETLLKYYKSHYSLKQLINIVEKYFNGILLVDTNFREFLEKHEEQLRKNPIFRKQFFKGEDLLKKKERIPRISLTNILEAYQKVSSPDFYEISNKLYHFQILPDRSFPYAQCNQDLKLYKNSIFLVDEKIQSSNMFGIHEGNNHFLAISGQVIKAISSLYNTAYFSGSSIGRFADMCFYYDTIDDKEMDISIISSQSRDPGQHLYHLFNYAMTSKKIHSIKDFNEQLKLPRHIFLTNPLRLIYESDKGNQKQLEKLLEFSFPIYHTESLANIWSYFSMGNDNGPIIDGREEGHISCGP